MDKPTKSRTSAPSGSHAAPASPGVARLTRWRLAFLPAILAVALALFFWPPSKPPAPCIPWASHVSELGDFLPIKGATFLAVPNESKPDSAPSFLPILGSIIHERADLGLAESKECSGDGLFQCVSPSGTPLLHVPWRMSETALNWSVDVEAGFWGDTSGDLRLSSGQPQVTIKSGALASTTLKNPRIIQVNFTDPRFVEAMIQAAVHDPAPLLVDRILVADLEHRDFRGLQADIDRVGAIHRRSSSQYSGVGIILGVAFRQILDTASLPDYRSDMGAEEQETLLANFRRKLGHFQTSFVQGALCDFFEIDGKATVRFNSPYYGQVRSRILQGNSVLSDVDSVRPDPGNSRVQYILL